MQNSKVRDNKIILNLIFTVITLIIFCFVCVSNSYALEDTTWQEEYNYILDNTNGRIVLSSYKGLGGDVVIPAKAVLNGTEYTTVVSYTYKYDSITKGYKYFFPKDNITSLKVEDNVSFTNLSHFFDLGNYRNKLRMVEFGDIVITESCSADCLFIKCKNLGTVTFGNICNSDNINNMASMFLRCENIQSVDLSNFDTKNVTDMSYMFCLCKSLREVKQNFNTSNVINMSDMFGSTAIQKLDLSNFDTKKVESIGWMFYECSALTYLDISGFDMSNILDADVFLGGCLSLKEIHTPKVNNADLEIMFASTEPFIEKRSDGTLCDVEYRDLMQAPEKSILIKKIKASSISLLNPRVELEVGNSVTLSAKVFPDDSLDKVNWSSSDTSVATVDSDGKVTAIKDGKATIFARAGYAQDFCSVTVYAKKIDDANKSTEDTKESENQNKEGETENAEDTKENQNIEEEKENSYAKYGLDDKYVPDNYKDNSGSPMIMLGINCVWNDSNGKSYWYENGIKQGTYYDPKGVLGTDPETGIATNRGREICDMSQKDDAGQDGVWFWLDSVYDGAKAVGKEVWVPYIYQNEDEWDDAEMRRIANESDEGMGDLVYDFMKNKKGKWVRYDENGRMIKGWVTIEGALAEKYPDQVGNTYYYDTRTGLMAKGDITIDGVKYHFDEVSGVLSK